MIICAKLKFELSVKSCNRHDFVFTKYNSQVGSVTLFILMCPL